MNEKQAERRKEILAVALQAFRERGYDKTSMDDVVEATGLSKGTIYWYFKNKQELFFALMEYVINQFFEDFETVFSTALEMTPTAAIVALFETCDAMLDTNPKIANFTLDFMLQALHYPEMRQQYAGYYARYIEELASIIQRGVDTDEFYQVDAHAVSVVLIGLLDGIMLQALISDEIDLEWRWQRRKILDVAKTLFLNGLGKGSIPDGQ
ncbi:MAG: TetR/AcrR family transcriptional regulator [Anaerolineae bacterium]|nr:TetR/AcrR family transcriptional regulator [Anaerolineae bacterium]